MELCRENLRRHIFFNVENIPGLTTAPAATKNVVRWAGNIADALKFIHSQGVVHRDLKLENTLVGPIFSLFDNNRMY